MGLSQSRLYPSIQPRDEPGMKVARLLSASLVARLIRFRHPVDPILLDLPGHPAGLESRCEVTLEGKSDSRARTWESVAERTGCLLMGHLFFHRVFCAGLLGHDMQSETSEMLGAALPSLCGELLSLMLRRRGCSRQGVSWEEQPSSGGARRMWLGELAERPLLAWAELLLGEETVLSSSLNKEHGTRGTWP